MLLAAAACLAVALASCSSTGEKTDEKTDAMSDQVHDPAACGCHIEDGELVTSWACRCNGAGSCGNETPANHCGTGLRDRIDYPDCGLTVYRATTANGPADSVFDRDAQLVGWSSSSDTVPFACPTDPSLTSAHVRAGVFPASSCEARTCAVCSEIEAFPCAAANSGS